jgi:[acyl-carrier-protein] S-malonyltransferase
MSRINVTGMLELAPAGTLSAIAKRELKEIQTFPLKTPTDLLDAKEFALSHQRRAA